MKNDRRSIQEQKRYEDVQSRSHSSSRAGLVLDGEESEPRILQKQEANIKGVKLKTQRKENVKESLDDKLANKIGIKTNKGDKSIAIALLQDEPFSQSQSSKRKGIDVPSQSGKIDYEFFSYRKSHNDLYNDIYPSKGEVGYSFNGGSSKRVFKEAREQQAKRQQNNMKFDNVMSPATTKKENLFASNEGQNFRFPNNYSSIRSPTLDLGNPSMTIPHKSLKERTILGKESFMGSKTGKSKVRPLEPSHLPNFSPEHSAAQIAFIESEPDNSRTINQTLFRVNEQMKKRGATITQNPSIQLNEEGLNKIKQMNQRFQNEDLLSATSQDLLKIQFQKIMANGLVSPNNSQRVQFSKQEQIVQEKLMWLDEHLTSMNDVSAQMTSYRNMDSIKTPTMGVYQANLQTKKFSTITPNTYQKFTHQYELGYVWQPFNEEGEKLMYNKKKLALDLYDMGFKGERVERAIRHCKDLRVEKLMNYLVPQVLQKFTYQWNHKFVPYSSRFKDKQGIVNEENNLQQNNQMCKICEQFLEDSEGNESQVNHQNTPHQLIKLPQIQNIEEDKSFDNETVLVDKTQHGKEAKSKLDSSTLILTSNYIIRSNKKLKDLQISQQIPKFQRGEIQRYFYKIYNQTVNHENSLMPKEESKDTTLHRRNNTTNINQVTTSLPQQAKKSNRHSHREHIHERKSTIQLTQSIRSNEAILYGEDNAIRYCCICLDLYEYHNFDYNSALLQILDEQYDGCLDESLKGSSINQNNQLMKVHLKSKLNNIKEEMEVGQSKSMVKLEKFQSQMEIVKMKIMNQSQVILGRRKDCLICFEPEEEIIKCQSYLITLECSHRFCSGCLVRYLRDQISKNFIVSFKCPSCKFFMLNSQVKELLEPKEWNKILEVREIILEGIIREVFYCHNCSHPYPKQRISPKGLIKCDTCSNIQCFQCDRNHLNFNETCKEALEREYKQTREGMICQMCPLCNKVCEIYPECQQHHLYCSHCDSAFCIFCRKPGINPHGDHLNPFSYDVCELIRRPAPIQHTQHQRDFINKDDHLEVLFKKFNQSGFKVRDKILVSLIYFIFLPFIGLFFLPIWWAKNYYAKKCLLDVPYYKMGEDQRLNIVENSSYKRKIVFSSIGLGILIFLISPCLLVPLLVAPIIILALKN